LRRNLNIYPFTTPLGGDTYQLAQGSNRLAALADQTAGYLGITGYEDAVVRRMGRFSINLQVFRTTCQGCKHVFGQVFCSRGWTYWAAGAEAASAAFLKRF